VNATSFLESSLSGVYALCFGSGGREGFCSVVLGSGTERVEKQFASMLCKVECRER
jgi:hypothetical protein